MQAYAFFVVDKNSFINLKTYLWSVMVTIFFFFIFSNIYIFNEHI